MDKAILEEIHGLLAADMLVRLKVGGLEAKDWAAIAKFLKDNAIDLTQANIKAEDDVFSALLKEADAVLPADYRLARN